MVYRSSPYQPCRRRHGKASLLSLLAISILNMSTIAMAQVAETAAPSNINAPLPTTSTSPPTQPQPAPVVTLAPFKQITSPPVSNAPITSAPISDAPTDPPTPPPAPTTSPTLNPTSQPSTTQFPTFSPSQEPTNYPTISHQPTGSPSQSAQPSWSPSTSTPTASPTLRPTESPLFAPSGSPSTTGTFSVKRDCSQILEVKSPEEFSDVQLGIYQLLMQSYTPNFGHFVGPPQIVTESVVINQNLAGGRKMTSTMRVANADAGHQRRGLLKHVLHRILRKETQTLRQTTKYLLVMEFTMEYESRFGFEVEDYPRQFQAYINDNLEQVTADMDSRFLPVANAQSVIVYNTDEPTLSPTLMDGELPSAIPTMPSAPRPTVNPTTLPSITNVPTGYPTISPTTNSPTSPPVGPDQTSFIIGLVAGLGGAAIVVLLLIWYMRRKNLQKENENRERAARAATAERENQQHDITNIEDGMEVRIEDDSIPVVGEGGASSSHHIGSSHNVQQQQQQQQQYDEYPPNENDDAISPVGGVGTIADSIFSNPSMVSGGGSFSSNPEDHYGEVGGVRLETLQDEFDSYKNQDLEYMRHGVEESVFGSEGMMSLAMTRALMEEEDVGINPSWGGAEDPESIEANALCETNDWLRKNEHSSFDERNIFFQEILNRMVVTVRRGMISPSDGTRAIHCCAAMLGLQLEKDLPNNVLLVHGMRKTNDLALGRSYLVDAFKSFGDIEGAAIAPSNRGFGFVRFVSPKSVQRALERFRSEEIEVQDVSVMIKSLKSDAPPV